MISQKHMSESVPTEVSHHRMPKDRNLTPSSFWGSHNIFHHISLWYQYWLLTGWMALTEVLVVASFRVGGDVASNWCPPRYWMNVLYPSASNLWSFWMLSGGSPPKQKSNHIIQIWVSGFVLFWNNSLSTVNSWPFRNDHVFLSKLLRFRISFGPQKCPKIWAVKTGPFRQPPCRSQCGVGFSSLEDQAAFQRNAARHVHEVHDAARAPWWQTEMIPVVSNE